jgi:hypothetical protein
VARQASPRETAQVRADTAAAAPPTVKPPTIDLSKVDSAIAGKKGKLDSSARVPVPPPTFKKP